MTSPTATPPPPSEAEASLSPTATPPPESMTPSEAEAYAKAAEDRFNDLFKATIGNEWDKVIEILKQNKIDHATKLTKSMETPLHAAIASYNYRTPSSSHEMHLKEMIKVMKDKGTLNRVLGEQNQKGDTPLHLAAAVGWQPIFNSMKEIDPKGGLLHSRNKKKETPLFLAALHGNLGLYRFLVCQFHPPVSLARREDGNTILHRAIFEENFGEYLLLKPRLVTCRQNGNLNSCI